MTSKRRLRLGAGGAAAGRRGAGAPGAQPAAGLAARAGRPSESRPAAGAAAAVPGGSAGAVCSPSGRRQLPSHAGQVSLAGRRGREQGETIEQAALREAREEIGARPGRRPRCSGALTPLHIPVSGFVLHPVVGVDGLRGPTSGWRTTKWSRSWSPRLDDLLDPAAVSRIASPAEIGPVPDVPISRSTAPSSGGPPPWCSPNVPGSSPARGSGRCAIWPLRAS